VLKKGKDSQVKERKRREPVKRKMKKMKRMRSLEK